MLLVFGSFEVVVTLVMIRLDVHLGHPCLAQVLLHDLVFSHEGRVLEVLCIRSRTNEFLICTPLILATCLTKLTVCVDLVGQVVVQEILLRLRRV